MGNFDVVSQSGSVTFPATGTWTDYFPDTVVNISSASKTFTLQPGEFHVYTFKSAGLPEMVINFSGTKENKSNLLRWKVQNENGVDHYDLEKSEDGQNYSLLETINPNGSGDYNFTDKEVSSSSVNEFYRLKIVNPDGKLFTPTLLH